MVTPSSSQLPSSSLPSSSMVNTRVKVGKYEAWIVIEDQEVEHYGIEVDEKEMVATCWIASTVGKHFGVWIVKHHKKFDCSAGVYLDGSLARRRVIRKSSTKPKLVQDVCDGGNSVLPFFFGVLDFTDDEVQTTQSYDELGSIKVEICHIVDLQRSTLPPNRRVELQPDKFPEGAKKSATHRVLFGKPKTVHSSSSTFKSLNRVATFVFHYRSLDMLRANEIVPRDLPQVSVTVNREPGPSKRKATMIEEVESSDVKNDSEEEYMRKEAELEAELEKVRKARLERKEGKHVMKKVKREQKPVFLPGEVIDLTI